MSQTLPLTSFSAPLDTRLPLIDLLRPGKLMPLVIRSLTLGIVAGWIGMRVWSLPLWAATFIVLAVLLPVGIIKWRADHLRYGTVIMIMSILLTAQGAHSIEHLLQWAQYHILNWTARQSTGLLSPANAEWVHFVWNWAVLLIIVTLIKGGIRNFWAYLLLAVAVAHTFEHTYMMVRYLQVMNELRALGVTTTAQGLPGILGRDGWLARSPFTRGTVLCSLPGLTTAVRLDVHFWWNVLEMTLLAVAGHVFLRQRSRH